MENSGLRDLGSVVPGARPGRTADAAPPVSRTTTAAFAPCPDLGTGTIFAADVPDAADALGLDSKLDLLSELVVHARTETPLTIGLLGRSGSGKSLALKRLVASIEALSAAARDAADTPFLSKIVALRIDASDMEGGPAVALAGALHASLAANYPALAVEAAHAASDPRLAAREAFERLDVARRKLEAERAALAESESRRARLTETLLFETAGSQVDVYARANRTRIKTALAAFGLAGDPIRDFKDMVRAIADREGGGRAGFALRAFWGLSGQRRLIATAILLILLGFGLDKAFADQTSWIEWLRANEQLQVSVAWISAHVDWLLTLRNAAFVGAAAALAVNVWRALRLILMTFRGERLLQADLFARRRETDGNFGHQMRRVEALTSEVESLGRRAAEAEQRAASQQQADPALIEPPPFAADLVRRQAQRFIAAVGALLQKNGRTAGASKPAIEAPQRIIVAFDNLDSAPAARVNEILAEIRGALGRGFATLIAADPSRLAQDTGEDETTLDKWIHIPFQVGEITAHADYATFVRDILRGDAASKARTSSADPRRSVLDAPLDEAEAKLLADLAPLAGSSARAVKRFVNLYRLIRTEAQDEQDHGGALALMLALEAGGTQGEMAAMRDALSGAKGDVTVDLHQGGLRLTEALATVQAAQGKLSVDAARRAASLARLFSFRTSGA